MAESTPMRCSSLLARVSAPQLSKLHGIPTISEFRGGGGEGTRNSAGNKQNWRFERPGGWMYPPSRRDLSPLQSLTVWAARDTPISAPSRLLTLSKPASSSSHSVHRWVKAAGVWDTITNVLGADAQKVGRSMAWRPSRGRSRCHRDLVALRSWCRDLGRN